MPLCMGCLNEIKDHNTVCEVCGFDNNNEQKAPFLPFETILSGKYVVARQLSTNGESTRYLGYDKISGKVVTIREFLPMGLFDRAAGETKLYVSPSERLKYTKAMSDFQDYYDTLTGISDRSAMVDILDTFIGNNTAYVIEENDDLIPLSEFLEHKGGRLDWDAARPLFMPVITLLENLHKAGIGHYAVSPSNLFVTPSGKLKLSGFCTENERKRGTMLKSQLFSGCAAPEQYRPDETLDIRTDIYGLTATLFYALTGNLPAAAKEREKDPRLLISSTTVKRLPPHVVTALANGLQMKVENRIADFDELRAQLSAATTVQAIQDEISRTASMTPIKKTDAKKSNVNPTAVGVVATIFALLIFSAVGLYWLSINPLMGIFTGGETTTPTVPAETEAWTGPVVQNYVGMTLDDVQKAVDADGTIMLKIAADGEFSDTVEKGKIISQEPKAGEPITQGSSALYVVVSKGPQLITLPDVKGKSVSAAAERLTELGFVVLQKNEYNDSVPEGKVMKYVKHKVGDQVESGSEITLLVSLGVEPSEEN